MTVKNSGWCNFGIVNYHTGKERENSQLLSTQNQSTYNIQDIKHDDESQRPLHAASPLFPLNCLWTPTLWIESRRLPPTLPIESI